MSGCWDICKFENLIQLQASISPQGKMIETWFKNWYAQLIMRNLNVISLNNFLSALGAYYSEYGTSDIYTNETLYCHKSSFCFT